MIIAFDKAVDANIMSITSDSSPVPGGDIYLWNSESASGWVIDKVNHYIHIGNDGVTIIFNKNASMEPYIEQRLIIFAKNVSYPSVSIRKDPFYDLPETGITKSFVYNYTDVEKDLIK